MHGGVAASIVKKGGKCILEYTEDIINEKIMIPTGTVAVTEGGRLNCKYIIHAVGPNLNDPS
jgi:O-acetyl-ADP-ribose deacetylase (regulator of RNase III)